MSGSVRALIWCGIAMGAVLVLGVLLMFARRLYVKLLTQKPTAEGFSIESLEELRDGGQISPEEFDRLRRVALGISGPANDEKGQTKSSADDEIDDEKKDTHHG